MKFKLSYLITLAGCVTILSSCTQTKHAVEHNNLYWQQLGYNDASQGEPPRELDAIKKDLKAVEAKQAYHSGWESGALAYCTPNRAYELGTHGKTYNTICPSKLANIFEASYQRGLESFCKTRIKKTGDDKEKNTLTICIHNNNESSERDNDETKSI